MTIAAPTAGTTLSIALRLGTAMALILVLVVAGTIAAANRYGEAAADEAFDRLLRGAALQIAERVTVIDGTTSVDLPVAAFELLSLARSDRVFYRIVGPDMQTVTGYDDLPLAARPGSGEQVYDATFKGVDIRAAVVTRKLAERSVSGSVEVIVAQTKQERRQLAARISTQAALTIAGAGLALLLLTLAVFRLALRPLVRVEQAILSRDADDLSPIAVPAPAEVAVLVDAVNRFMGRLERRINEMENFVADAAHQIRTPITALRAQAQIALDESDPDRLDRVHRRIYSRSVGLGRLADQLLSRALTAHRADAAMQQTLDLRRVALEAEREVRAVGNQAIDMVLPDEDVPVRGDLISLREAVKNLLNNAAVHGTAPIQLLVLRGDTGAARIVVRDAGPGIPDAMRGRIGQRFSSDGVSAESAGLGLSIVAVVAAAHGAHLVMQKPDAGGFEIGIEFGARP